MFFCFKCVKIKNDLFQQNKKMFKKEFGKRNSVNICFDGLSHIYSNII